MDKVRRLRYWREYGGEENVKYLIGSSISRGLSASKIHRFRTNIDGVKRRKRHPYDDAYGLQLVADWYAQRARPDIFNPKGCEAQGSRILEPIVVKGYWPAICRVDHQLHGKSAGTQYARKQFLFAYTDPILLPINKYTENYSW